MITLSHIFSCEINKKYDVVQGTVFDTDPNSSSVSTVCKWIPLSELETIELVPKIGKQILSDLKMGKFEMKFLEDLHYQD